jgi:predicted dehydrogenase
MYTENKHHLKVALIGYGYWGKILAKSINLRSDYQLHNIIDQNRSALREAELNFPNARLENNAKLILKSKEIDAVIIASPAKTHFKLALEALEEGKHVLVTKPAAISFDELMILKKKTEDTGLSLLVDHTFLYSPAVQKIKDILDKNILGKIIYFDSIRTGLGIIKDDVDIIHDLAIHDLAILDFLFGEGIKNSISDAKSAFSNMQLTQANINLNYFNGMNAHINVNWISPLKQRQLIIAGDNKILVWNDQKKEEKLLIYDTGVEIDKAKKIIYKNGNLENIKYSERETLQFEFDNFINSIKIEEKIISDINTAIRIENNIKLIKKAISNNY